MQCCGVPRGPVARRSADCPNPQHGTEGLTVGILLTLLWLATRCELGQLAVRGGLRSADCPQSAARGGRIDGGDFIDAALAGGALRVGTTRGPRLLAERGLSQSAARGGRIDGGDFIDAALAGGALRVGTTRGPVVCLRSADCPNPQHGTEGLTVGMISMLLWLATCCELGQLAVRKGNKKPRWREPAGLMKLN